DLDDLEQFVRWRYDWDINIEGIEAMHHLLGKVRALQAEVERLQNELDFYKKIF
ncbi:MAG: MerR family transcriptional regulator, heat shock protein HspR, partial [Bacteroidota bacterium]|nr:MerR family transcriptional regulator, heat shock protein HspR [Bacteroidota bacterium]